ncbi:hypothetical protein [Achromobacter phage Motura]|uniref:Uncharacterized protein n=1 Tax=Achromobacter phage Motura TaxID=2591403 RepID=A0A514CSW1_9CAUD|nr:hypothetical protein H1O15_gp225 [Achromobacter phage Motura]QDH83563.1 hypothetical protein [Achromobacter phage Motura]
MIFLNTCEYDKALALATALTGVSGWEEVGSGNDGTAHGIEMYTELEVELSSSAVAAMLLEIEKNFKSAFWKPTKHFEFADDDAPTLLAYKAIGAWSKNNAKRVEISIFNDGTLATVNLFFVHGYTFEQIKRLDKDE